MALLSSKYLANPNTNRPRASCGDLVTLNVEGELFVTKRATLLKYSKTLFEELLVNETRVITDKNGAIFIDQCSDVFKVILRYLREGTINRRHLKGTGVSIMKLQKAASIYKIPALTVELNQLFPPEDCCFDKVLTHPGILHRGNYEGRVRSIKIQATWAIFIYTDFVVAQDIDGSLVCARHWKSPNHPGITHAEACLYNLDDTRIQPSQRQHIILSTKYELHVWYFHMHGSSYAYELPLRSEFAARHEIEDVKWLLSRLLLVTKEPETESWYVDVYTETATQCDWHQKEISSNCVVTSPLVVNHNEAFFANECHIWGVLSTQKTLVYQEKTQQSITALSVTGNGSVCEIAYGTRDGEVGIIHRDKPSTPFFLMRTFWVHSCEIEILNLSHRYLVSMCSNDNHIRTWELQRGPKLLGVLDRAVPKKSFSLVAPTKKEERNVPTKTSVNLGPFCCNQHHKDGDSYFFLQRPTLESNKLFFRRVADSKTICTMKSPDNSPVIGWAMEEYHKGPSDSERQCTHKLITTHENKQTYIWNTDSCDFTC